MKLIDRCSTCKYLKQLHINHSFKYCTNLELAENMNLENGAGIYYDDYTIILQPNNFGCILWEGKK